MNKPISQAYYLKEQLREIWMQPNKQEAKGQYSIGGGERRRRAKCRS